MKKHMKDASPEILFDYYASRAAFTLYKARDEFNAGDTGATTDDLVAVKEFLKHMMDLVVRKASV